MRWTGHIIRRVEKWNVCRFLVGKPEGRRLLGSPICRWEDNIKMDVREIGWGVMDWIHLLRIRTSGRFLLGNSRVAELLVDSQEGLSSMELVPGIRGNKF
jgi:hypothetical protein